jgi:hypothetical protein
LFPNKRYGSFPDIDQFIVRGETSDGVRMPHPEKRWTVDDQPFPNLTKAREHVRDTLGIVINSELGTETEYTPPTGWTHSTQMTKGNTMARKTTTAAEIKPKMEAAQTALLALQAIPTADMSPEQLGTHQRAITSAKSKVSYQKNMHRSAEEAESASKKAERLARKAENKETISGAHAAPVAKAPVQQLPNHMDRIGEATHIPRYEMTFPMAGGRQVSIKVNEVSSLDEVFGLIIKHGL